MSRIAFGLLDHTTLGFWSLANQIESDLVDDGGPPITTTLLAVMLHHGADALVEICCAAAAADAVEEWEQRRATP